MAKAKAPGFKVHAIDPDKVAESVTKSIDKHLYLRDRHLDYWKGKPDAEERTKVTQPLCDRAIYEELTYYINAYVQQDNPEKFWLMYDSAEVSGTGPFTTRKQAEDWFLNGGR